MTACLPASLGRGEGGLFLETQTRHTHTESRRNPNTHTHSHRLCGGGLAIVCDATLLLAALPLAEWDQGACPPFFFFPQSEKSGTPAGGKGQGSAMRSHQTKVINANAREIHGEQEQQQQASSEAEHAHALRSSFLQ